MAALLFTIIAIVATSVSARAQGAEFTVPNFWDHKAVHDRPAVIPDKIQFLATDNYPPFVFRDPQGRLTGFNVDLSRALCQELNISCALKIKDFEVLIPALEEEEGDAIISGLSRYASGAEDLLFTDDYLKLPARLIVLQDAPAGFSATLASGQSLAVETGSRHEAFARRFWPGADIKVFPTSAEARQAVKDGQADAHLGDGLNLSFWLRSPAAGGCCRFSGGPWLEPGYFDEGMAIATRSSDRERASALNYALRQLHQTGVYQELYLRYFPLSFY